MVVHPSVPAKNLQEFIALAKAQPGALNYASSGPGTPYHMAGELFKAMSGTDIVHVPHSGSGEARTSVIGGQVQMMIDAITTMAPNVEAGQVRALGTTGQTRSSVLPDVPTVAEAGVPGYEATIWLGLMAPAGTPQADRRQAQRRDRQGAEPPRGAATAWAKQGAVPMHDDAGRVRQIPARRHREVGEGGASSPAPRCSERRDGRARSAARQRRRAGRRGRSGDAAASACCAARSG